MINSKSFKKWATITLVAFLTITLLSIKKSACSKIPNVILISIDTLRADHLSCYGYFRKTSPNIDSFVSDAVLFKNAISQSPQTTPAHMSIFTSLTPAVHNVEGFHEHTHEHTNVTFKRLDEQIETLPVVMKKNGYLTIGLHGGGSVVGELGFDKGFDRYRDEWNNESSLTEKIDGVRKAIKESKEKNKPLFLFLHHYICHDPYLNAPEEFGLHFLSEKVDGLPVRREDILKSDDFSAVENSFWKNVDLNNPRHRNHIISLYDGGVYYSDYLFGKLIETLKEEDYYENSIIILLSDHGEEFYEHQDRGHWRLFIETLHVALICKFPAGMYGKRIIYDLVRTLDVMPTLFDFLGIKTDNFMQGISFLPLLTKKGDYHPLIVSYANQGTIDDKPVRFIKDAFIYSNQPSKGTDEWLFDIRNDPLETKNLSANNREIINQMRIIAKIILEKDRVIREKLGCKKDVFIEKDKKLLDQLKSLGYIQ
jgi:arylsulfatase A-like enzyme